MTDAREALAACAIEYSQRKDGDGELDVWMTRAQAGVAVRRLPRCDFHFVDAPGRGSHRAFVACANGTWAKIDAKLSDPGPAARLAQVPLVRRVLRALPLGLRRKGCVVAFLGPDGSGKGTVIDALTELIPVDVTTSYMGEPRRGNRKASTGGVAGATPGAARESAWMVVRFLRFWRRLLPAYVAAWRGTIVILDRHPGEALALRPRRGRAGALLEPILLGRMIPAPDAFVLLDAPAEVLVARKQELSAEVLEARRRDYTEAFGNRSVMIDTTAPLPDVVARASQAVFDALAERRGW